MSARFWLLLKYLIIVFSEFGWRVYGRCNCYDIRMERLSIDMEPVCAERSSEGWGFDFDDVMSDLFW